MARIPVPQQLQRSDLPDAPDWVSKLLYPLQLFMTSVVGALTNQLTIQENFSVATNSLIFTAAASADLNRFTFVWPYTRQPIALWIHATRRDGTTPPIYPVPSWNLVGNNISINGIQGLTAGVSYLIQTVAM